MSPAQRKSIEAVRSRFDTRERLFAAYSPKNWPYVVSRMDECFSRPDISLHQLDMVYGEGTASRLVANQITGIYSSTNTRDVLRQDALNQNADMFVAKYGHECTLNGMMLYFANYPLEYKASYAQFDLVDILQQFGKKFLPWWRMKLQPEKEDRKTGERPVGKDGLIRYIADELLAGTSVAEFKASSGLYAIGRITDDDIARAVEIAQEEF